MLQTPLHPGTRAADAAYLGQALQARLGEFIALRRELHRQPELAFEEHGTAELVATRLQSWGYEVTRGLGKTGVVGCRTPSNITHILRADDCMACTNGAISLTAYNT